MEVKSINVTKRMSRELKFLHAGTPVNIDIMTPAGQRGRFRTIFIGYLPQKYVLIQFPEASKLGNYAQYIGQGTAITVRGLIEGHEAAVVAFVTSVKQTLQIPSRIMVLHFPKDISIQRLRTTKRVQTELLAKAKLDGKGWQALITDVSPTGCHIEISHSDSILLKENTPVEILVDDYQELGDTKLMAKVCNIKPRNDGVAFGCQFEEKQEDIIERVMQYALLSGE